MIDPLPIGEEGSYVPGMDADVEVELADGCNCMVVTARVEFILTVMITSVDWSGLHAGESTIIYNGPF